mgnify:CR=1 FL=1
MRTIIKFLILIVLAIIAWGGGFFYFSNSIPTTTIKIKRFTDAIVVLTGGSGRLETGIDLLSAGGAERLFISGVYQGIDVTTLLQMFRDNPTNLEMRVDIGNATNTQSNASETAEWAETLNIRSIQLVTSAYHMPRSLLEFKTAMPDVSIYPFPVFPAHVKSNWWRWPGSAELVFKEYNKFLFAWLRLAVTKPFDALT